MSTLQNSTNTIEIDKKYSNVFLVTTVVTVVTDRWRDLAHWLLNPAPPAWTQVISQQNPDSHNSPQGSENAFSPSKRIIRQIGGHSPHSGTKHFKQILSLYF